MSAAWCPNRWTRGLRALNLRGLVDLREVRPLRVVVDAGNGMAGLDGDADRCFVLAADGGRSRRVR